MAHTTGGLAAAIDVADEAQIEALIARPEEEQGPIAVLVNSAGVLQRILSPGDLTMKDWDLVARIDPWHLCLLQDGGLAHGEAVSRQHH
jgi:NAD(P)-dependent dehydrogenase (short-subunit alcohol dehydrogenase family)